MVFPSSWISQSIQAQNSMFAGMQSYAMQASYGSGLMQGPPPPPVPPMAPPPPPSMMGVMRGFGGYAGGANGGQWGEAMAGRAYTGMQMGAGLAGAGMAMAGAAGSMGLIGGGMGMAASMMDPMGLAMRAGAGTFGMMGGGMGGLAMGGMAAASVAAVPYAAMQYGGALARNFGGGMQDQMSLNNTLRNNFNFQGGQGAFGRGFNQSQMGQIGGMVSQESRSNLMTNAGELNQVIAGGAQMGSFTGVRDVQDFGRRFREMLTTLRSVQRELGGNLTEAMDFVQQSRQAGIFGGTSATRFAGTIRTVSAATGFDQGQLVQLAANGAQIARAVGGRGEQGAHGALRGISTVSAALQGGMISEAMLSEATGGRTGQDAMSSFVTDMMGQSGRFSRTAAGRYSIFGLANREGTGLDQGALMDFQSGDMGAGQLSRRAHHRVGQMGRAQAVNREGLLRGALMEQGGMAGQLGMMRMMVGDRAMDGGDDTMSLVMQRRLHMSRPQAEIMTSLMRNQGSIAAREADDAVGSSREGALRSDITQHRSADAFMRHLEHEVGDATGMLRARDMGRSFVTRMSGMAERLMNDILGISSDQMGSEGQRAMSHLRQGRASGADLTSLGMGAHGWAGGQQSFSLDAHGLTETGPTAGARLRARGMDTSGVGTFGAASDMMTRAQMADSGIVTSAGDLRALRGLNGDASSGSRILQARLAAQGSGNADDVFRFMGGSGNATAAYMSQHGIHNDARMDGMGRLMGRGNSGSITAGMVGRDALRMLGVGAAGMVGGIGGAMLGAGAFAGIGGDTAMTSEVMRAMRDPDANSLDFLARGGHTGSRLGRLSQRSYFGGGRNGTAMSDRDRGLQAAIGGLSREDMQGLQNDDGFSSRMRAAMGAGSPEERATAMERLTSYANSQDGNTSSFRAMGSIVTQMQESLSRNGQFGSEFNVLGTNDAARRAAQAQVEQYSSSMHSIGRQGGGRIGRTMSAMGTYAYRGDSEGLLAAQTSQRRAVLGASDEEYSQFTEGAMSMAGVPDEDREQRTAEARAAVLGFSHMRAIDRDLRGEGRRGRRGATETAFGEMTGYSMGSMELQIGGRSISGQRAQTMIQNAFAGQGRNAMGIQQQVVRQMRDPNGMGLSADQASEARRILATGMSHRGRDGAFTAEDRERMSAFTNRDDIRGAMEGAQTRRAQQALSSAQSQDPVGREQIRLLGEVNSVLRERLRGPEGGEELMSHT